MTTPFTIGLIQMRMSKNTRENLDKACAMLEQAAAKGVQVACLPELFLSEYFCQKIDQSYFDLAEPIDGPTIQALSKIAQKTNMAIVASIRHPAITNDYNDGARALKNYLHYADALSSGDQAAARRVLWEINPAEDTRKGPPQAQVFTNELAARLRERGYNVDLNVGQSGFRCDLAVRSAGDRAYRLGILIDTDAYYQNSDILERDVLRPRLLRLFGWEIVLVLTKDWLEDAASVVDAIEKRLIWGACAGGS